MALIASVAFWFIAFLLIIPSLFRNWESSARKIFSATVTPEMVPLSCTTIPIPFCSASIILAGSQLCFLKVILPLVAFCMPAAIEDMVDFPEPFSPIKPLISPGYTSRSTFFSAITLPKFLEIFFISRIGSLMFTLRSLENCL